MSKGLEELERMAYENACCRCQYYTDKKCTNKDECVWKIIEKELKALEIINNKNVIVSLIKTSHRVEQYNINIEQLSRFDNQVELVSKVPRNLNKEEYDLLKEVLL